jgi:hypothetical protein
MIEPEAARAARDGIADTLASIDRGELEADEVQRAYLAGAVAALDGVTTAGSEAK